MTKPLTFKNWLLTLTIYIVIAAVALGVTPWFGAVKINVASILRDFFSNNESINSMIFFRQRVPRVVLGFCVGASLGLAGAAFQVLLRNSLATPYTLGIASAGTLCAALSFVFPSWAFSIGPFSTTYILAFAGSAFAAIFIMLLARRAGNTSTNTLILAGVAVNLFCGAALLFLRFIADPQHLVAIDRWVMGGIITIGYSESISIFVFLLIAGFFLMINSHSLNQMAFGEALAGSRGVNTKKLFFTTLGAGVILTTSAVAVAGPIGFVGLIIPHGVRIFSGNDQRIVLPASALASGALLVICDAFARTIVSPTEIPVGIITAFLGAPIFMILLIKRLNK
ncbi:MAG: iron ABC transporter permease [Chlamydiae bacterium]|nr:MAG: iron ABC transporter permease [Chlamydiota bacterium]